MKISAVSLALLVFCSIAAPVRAQSGAAARLATELGGSLLRRGGTEAAARSASELAQFGGERAIREVLEAAEKEGGEVLMRQVAQQTEKHGILALTALKGANGPVIRAVDGLPAELAENGLRAVAHQPQIMRQLVSEAGEGALRTVAKLPPGVGSRIGGSLGREGLETAGKLADDEARLLGSYADDLAKLPAEKRSAWLSWMKESPEKVFGWMKRHPRTTVVAVLTGTVIAAKDQIFGIGDQKGMLERMGASIYEAFKNPLHTAAAALAALIVGWSAFKLLAIRRAFRRKAV